MNTRHKFGDIPSLRGISSVSRGKVQIAGEAHDLDDSRARTFFVDVVTEAAAANGIVCIGLGHLIFPPEGKAEVEGDVHLRLSVPMAASLVETLSDALRRASEQQTKVNTTLRAN